MTTFNRFRPRLSHGIGLLLVIFVLVIPSGVALAHARLVRSNPEDGAVLSEAPHEAYLWFDESVATQFSTAQLLDATGQSVGEVNLRADPADANVLIATLPSLSEGVYSLAWKIVSAVDAHPTKGTLVFGVNQAVEGVARLTQADETLIAPIEVVLNVLNVVALAILSGSLLVAGLIVHPQRFAPLEEPVVTAAQQRLIKLSLISALVALAIGVWRLIWRATTLDRGSLVDLLAARFGALLLAYMGLLLIMLVALIAVRRGLGWGWISAGIALIALAVVQALNSHAAALPADIPLAVTVNAIHLLAAGAWVGSLVALLVALGPLLLSHQESARAIALQGWRRFSRLAVLGVGVLAATGLYNTARQVASVDAWIATLYGQVLAGKMILFLCVGLAGLLNSSLLHPRVARAIGRLLHRPEGWVPFNLTRLPIILLTEATLGIVVLALTGWLTAAPPARGPEFAPSDTTEKIPSSASQSVNDLLINLDIRPNKPGLNIVSIGAFTTRRPPPAEIIRVQVRFTYLGRDLGTQTVIAELDDAGRYRASTSALSLAGAWRAEVIIRRNGMEDANANFDWRVEPLALSTSPRPVIISNAPLAPSLTMLALGLIIATGLTLPTLMRLGKSAAPTDPSS